MIMSLWEYIRRSAGIIEFPRFFDVKAKDVIRKLLNPEYGFRLGVSDVRLALNVS
jgi:hypothetical protein